MKPMMPEKTPSLWRGFPRTGNVKVWVGEDDSVGNALNLYHPYSRSGHVLTDVIRTTPEGFTRRLFTDICPATVTEQLDVLSRIIRTKFKNKRVAISFGAGTPGPHHKLTAQVSHEGRVVSYVKVGQGEAVSKLLQAEAEMLTWLHEQNFQAAVFPAVLALEQSHDRTLLFLSAPAEPGNRTPLKVSSVEATFLCALNSLNTRVIPVTTALNMLGFTPFLLHLQSIEPNAGNVLRDAGEAVEKIFEKAGVQVACCHGDYAPWNTLILSGGELYAFDWEYGLKEAPMFADLFHRVLMPGRLVCDQKPKEIVQGLLNASTDPMLGSLFVKFRVLREEIVGYVLIYLIQLAMRESTEGQVASLYVLECLHHVLIAANHPSHRRRVLVAAYACEPNSGSEPGVGWNMCQAISKAHEAWVVTRKNNRDQIEQAMALQPNRYLHFIYTDLPRWASFWKKQGRGIRLYYYLWQFLAWRQARRVGQTVDFDLAHHVTFVNDWLFTFLAFLPVPFVWGPIGSHPKSPRRLTSSLSALIADRVRYYFQAFMRFIDPLFWMTAARARLIIGIDESVGQRFPLSFLARHKFIIHPAIGVESLFEHCDEQKRTLDSIRILSMGRLVPIKAFHLTIRAFAVFEKIERSATLTIVGKGPERASLQTLATRLGVDDRITFIDWLPRTQALSEMQKADLFLFPSFEGGGMVVLEAMAHGVPVLSLKYGGPGEMVTEECGCSIQVGNQEKTVRDLADAIQIVVKNQQLHAALSAGARSRVKDRYLWENRYCMIREWYAACGFQSNFDEYREKPTSLPGSRQPVPILNRLMLLGLCASICLVSPPSSLADRSVEEAMERYRNIAGSHSITVKGNRAEFSDGVTTWTILGATQDNGKAHIRSMGWSVGKQPYQILAVDDPISDAYILPYSDPVPNSSNILSLDMSAARGEIESVSFVIRSGDYDLNNVVIVSSELTKEGTSEQIAADHVDIRLVKSWYQSSDSIHRQHGGGKVLVPELLLHDSDLVRVDHQEQVNLVKNISSLRDAERIVPFTLPSRTNQQVWITVAIPPQSIGGRYRGDIKVTFSSQGKVYSPLVSIVANVLPFRLSQPPVEYALYYLAWLNTGKPNLDARAKTFEQLGEDLKDMRAHGLTNVAVDHNYFADGAFTNLSQTFRQMRAADFKTNRLLYVDWKVSDSNDSERYSHKVESLVEVARAHGFFDVFLYNLDEKDSQTLLKNRQSFQIAHNHGAKNFVAFNSGGLESLSGILDLAVLPRGTVRTVNISKKVSITPWAYGDPQAGEEKPFTYRDRYGVNLWLDGFDGACDYAYQTGTFGWDDWGDPKWRPHNMAYPTLSKPIPTLQWEGFREGIDDSRYLATAIPMWQLEGTKESADRRKLLSQVLGGVLPTTPQDLRRKLTDFILSRVNVRSSAATP